MRGHTCSPGSCSCGESGSGKPSTRRANAFDFPPCSYSDGGVEQLVRSQREKPHEGGFSPTGKPHRLPHPVAHGVVPVSE